MITFLLASLIYSIFGGIANLLLPSRADPSAEQFVHAQFVLIFPPVLGKKMEQG